MSKSPLPLILAGGAALLLLGGSRRKGPTRKIVEADFDVVYAPAQAPAEETPPPESLPSTHREVSDQEIGQMLLELGYQGYSPAAIMEFQKDWNSMMMWLWENNPQIDEDTPNYGPIDIDGKWGKKTESRAVRALKNVPPGERVAISLGDKAIEVDSFRDMVRKVWEYTNIDDKAVGKVNYKVIDLGEGLTVYHFRAANGLDGYVGELFLQNPKNHEKIIIIRGRAFDGLIPRAEAWYNAPFSKLTRDEFIKKMRMETLESVARFIDDLIFFETYYSEARPIGKDELLKKLVNAMLDAAEGFHKSGFVSVDSNN